MPSSKIPQNQTEFTCLFPNAKRLPEFDSKTLQTYQTDEFIWMFDKADGHLAYIYSFRVNMAIYECDGIKAGRRIVTDFLKQLQVTT